MSGVSITQNHQIVRVLFTVLVHTDYRLCVLFCKFRSSTVQYTVQ